MTPVRIVTSTLVVLPVAAQLGLVPHTTAAQSRFTTASQAEQLRFRDMDRNGDGVITRAEWRGSEQSFRIHDWNNDGILSGDEVRPGAMRPGAGTDDSAVSGRHEDFETLDSNRSGRIEQHEWRESLDAFRWLDRDGDGTLSRAEVTGTPERTQSRRARTAVPRGAGGSAQQDCVANAAQVVDDVYQQVLERPADQASAELTHALAAGRMTVRDVVAHVAKSPEHAQRFFWQPLVTEVYRQTLQREPDQQELRRAAGDLAAGRVQLIDVEARAAAQAARDGDDAIRILYRSLLGREPDDSGRRSYTAMAERNGIEAVARHIMASAEYTQRTATSDGDTRAHEAAVRHLYEHLLDREPDPQGLRDLTQVARSSGVDAVVDRMLASTEYERTIGSQGIPGRGSRYCGTPRP